MQWLGFFQRSHHSSVQHLPLVQGGAEPWPEPLPITQQLMQNCRMDGRQEKMPGYEQSVRPLASQIPLGELPNKLPVDDLYVPNADALPEAPPGPPELKRTTLCGNVLSSFPTYRRVRRLTSTRSSALRRTSADSGVASGVLGEAVAFGEEPLNLVASYKGCKVQQELCAACWREAHVEDA